MVLPLIWAVSVLYSVNLYVSQLLVVGFLCQNTQSVPDIHSSWHALSVGLFVVDITAAGCQNHPLPTVYFPPVLIFLPFTVTELGAVSVVDELDEDGGVVEELDEDGGVVEELDEDGGVVVDGVVGVVGVVVDGLSDSYE
jgi:hypothetical protein